MFIYFISSVQEEILFLDYIESGGKCVPVSVEDYKKVLDKTFQWATVEEVMSNNHLSEHILQDGVPFYLGATHSKEAIFLKCFVQFRSGKGFTPFQLEAMKQGLNPFSFIVFEPTDYAVAQGYKTLFYPSQEGVEKWEDYKAEGLDSLFYFFKIEE